MTKDLHNIIKKMAGLACLEFDEKGLKRYAGHAENILKYFEKLNELDTKGARPSSHSLDGASRLRDDEVVKFEGVAKIMDAVPEKDGGFIEVPKVI